MAASKNKTNNNSSHARHNKHQKTAFGKSSIGTRIGTLAPLIGVLAILPLLVRLYTYDSGLQYYDFYGNTAKPDIDVFLHCKMVFFLFLSIVMACILIARLVIEKKEIRFSKIFIPLGAYALLALLSSIFSKYQPYPWTGVYEQFEPVFVLLGYVITAYYAFLFVEDSTDITILTVALMAGTFIIVVIGITQVFFTDFFQTSLGYQLIVPKSLQAAYPRENMTFEFAAEGRAYLTLYNPNYVGSYVALLSPLFLMMIFAYKNLIFKVFGGLVYVFLLFALFGSGSRAGFIGIAFSLLMLCILFARKNWKFWIPVLSIFGLTCIILIGYIMFSSGPKVIERLQEAFSTGQRDPYALTKIETNDSDVVLTWKGNDLHIITDADATTFNCIDSSGSLLPLKLSDDGNSIIIGDERFADVTISALQITDPERIPAFSVTAGGTWRFAYVNNSYYYITIFGKLIKYENAEYTEFLDKHAALASKRGFIWSRTIPLLKKNIILGSGADTFIFEFPNKDVLGMNNAGFNQWGKIEIMTKPHNMYLQVGVQTGVISLIAMLAFYIMYLVTCIKTSFKMKTHNFYSYISGGIAAGTFGYMITQLINDSSITVAPLYWALIGIGFSTCLVARKENAEVLQQNL